MGKGGALAPRGAQFWEQQVFRSRPGVRRHLTSGFRPVERSICIHRAWCAGTFGLSRATWANSDTLRLDMISWSRPCQKVTGIVRSTHLWETGARAAPENSCRRKIDWINHRLLSLAEFVEIWEGGALWTRTYRYHC